MGGAGCDRRGHGGICWTGCVLGDAGVRLRVPAGWVGHRMGGA